MSHYKKRLENKVAIVTGGTSGIGKAIALSFAQEGACVHIIGTNHERGSAVLEELKEFSSENHAFHALNIADGIQVMDAFKEIIEQTGQIDILVNNAGITRDQLILKMKEEEWDLVMDINLKSCFHTMKAVARPMIKKRDGVIINISSVVALSGNPGQANYTASKGGMISLTKTIAKELGSRGIRANCIAPGFIDTAMSQQLPESQRKEWEKEIPLKRFGFPKEVAQVAVFLASNDAKYITGQVIQVDGGLAM